MPLRRDIEPEGCHCSRVLRDGKMSAPTHRVSRKQGRAPCVQRSRCQVLRGDLSAGAGPRLPWPGLHFPSGALSGSPLSLNAAAASRSFSLKGSGRLGPAGHREFHLHRGLEQNAGRAPGFTSAPVHGRAHTGHRKTASSRCSACTGQPSASEISSVFVLRRPSLLVLCAPYSTLSPPRFPLSHGWGFR